MCLKKIGKNVNPNPGGVPGFCLELDAGGGYVGQAYMHWCMIFCVHEFRETTAQPSYQERMKYYEQAKHQALLPKVEKEA